MNLRHIKIPREMIESTIRTENEHQELVDRLAKDGEAILNSLTPNKCHMLHMLIGKMSELGELADAFKKHIIYEQPLDEVNVIEEMGDEEWYSAGLRQSLGHVRAYVLQKNIEKLTKRYPDQSYTDKHAEAREDKKQRLNIILQSHTTTPGNDEIEVLPEEPVEEDDPAEKACREIMEAVEQGEFSPEHTKQIKEILDRNYNKQ